jgi:hypothetical protein
MPKIDVTGSIARAADSAKNIAIIVGIAVTMFGLYKGYNELAMSARSQKLSTFGTVKELIKADEEQRAKMNEILEMKIPELLKKHDNIEHFYDSPEGLKIASVGRHYEQLGALVRLGYVDFDLVYEVIPFPDEFWRTTAPIRKGARSNWSAGKGLPDFWENFKYLKRRYYKQRKLDSEEASRSEIKAH